FFAPPAPPTVTGGVAEDPVSIPGSTSGSPRLSGSILQVNGMLYISSPDNAWAMDALDGHVIWHYWWKSRGGTHIGNRGMAMYGDWLFFETPDDYLVSLDAKTGRERWHKEIADFNQQYFSTTAPVVVGDHVLVGTGDDLDAPGFLQSFDPKTGDLQWKFYTVPMKRGDPGLDTWASLDAAQHGGAQVWIPGSYDAETHLYIFGTGNPTPAYTARLRAPRDAPTRPTGLPASTPRGSPSATQTRTTRSRARWYRRTMEARRTGFRPATTPRRDSSTSCCASSTRCTT